MKIAFIGDSYCEAITDGSWLFFIAEEYNANIIANGIGGRHLFHAYEVLLDVVDEADYIIFCISEPYRVPNKHGMHITPLHYGTDYEHLKGELETFHQLYYNDFISFKWHEVAQKGLLMQIDELMLQKKKKCIWFPSFDTSMQGFIPKSGPITDVSLLPLSDTELLHLNLTPESRYKLRGNDILRLNHFNEENNKRMSELIIDIINNDNFTPRLICMDLYFKGLKEL